MVSLHFSEFLPAGLTPSEELPGGVLSIKVEDQGHTATEDTRNLYLLLVRTENGTNQLLQKTLLSNPEQMLPPPTY